MKKIKMIKIYNEKNGKGIYLSLEEMKGFKNPIYDLIGIVKEMAADSILLYVSETNEEYKLGYYLGNLEVAESRTIPRVLREAGII